MWRAKWPWDKLLFQVIPSSFVVTIPPLLHARSSIIRKTNNDPIRGHSSAEAKSHAAQRISNLCLKPNIKTSHAVLPFT